MALTIVLLDSREHKRSSFSCGEESLNNYIRKQAAQYLNLNYQAIALSPITEF
ncbi:hypothetical protein [[Phormidium ambiguum] IAM M-71]|uniref:hypothetical protein n=1 Tax=[Phormidium ambiguum] IAM M-71 TaxID=454136 RepID=UPI0015BB80AD|nr:hypothetical protein [Phormidium ambiguum]